MAASDDELTARIEAGDALSDQDVAHLGASRDIIMLGMLASIVRRRLHGTEVTYVRVADLKLAAGGTLDGPDHALASQRDRAGEVRIFETPKTLETAEHVVARARETADGTPLSAFCLYELSKLPQGLPVTLAALKKAGLDLITQAPIDRLSDPERALETLTDAGLQLSRLTVNETPAREWTAVCRDVAALQTKLGSIRAFAPLAREIDTTHPTTGYEDVKRIAIARLLMESVPTVQVDWGLYGPKLAQVALMFGADDLDSVSAEDDDSHGRRRAPIEEIRRSIRAAGFEPVERDARFKRRH